MKMKIKKKGRVRAGVLAVAICCFSFLGAISVNAEMKGNVPVIYTKEESDIYSLKVEAKGNGEVLCGEDVIRNNSKGYELAIDENMTLQLKPDSGSSVKKVTLNGESVSEKVKDSVLVVEGAEKDQTVSVEFETKSGSGMGIFGPKTGDFTTILPYVLLIIVAAAVIILAYSNKRKRNVKQALDDEENDNGKA